MENSIIIPEPVWRAAEMVNKIIAERLMSTVARKRALLQLCSIYTLTRVA
jgi:hypothetical protein